MPRRFPRRPRALAAASGAAALAGLALLLPATAAAHGFERPYSLPVPLWLYLAGAAAAVAASFIVAALAIRQPSPEPRYPMLSLPRTLSSAVALLFVVIGLVWWVAIISGGLTGALHPFLPAVFLWVLLWVGVPIVSVVLGNPWPALSPFRSIFGLYEGISRMLGSRPFRPPYVYPSVLSRWPAVVLLLVFLAFEFVVPGSNEGRQIAMALLGYSGLTLFAMALFGHAWLRNAEVLEVLFGWFGRIGAIGRRSTSRDLCEGCPEGCRPDRCVDCPDCMTARGQGEQVAVARPWFAGLTDVTRADWSDAAFILLALAGVSYDGLRETAVWARFVGIFFEPIQGAIGPLNTVIAIEALGLLALWLAFVIVFSLAAWLTRLLAGVDTRLSALAGAYAATLLPIAAGYLIAHYFTLFIQGISWLPQLLTDPASIAPKVDWIPSGVIWYVSVAAIVIGHIAAVLLAHRLALLQRAARATLVGLPLVAVMLGYTIFSLWIIAQPLTVEPFDRPSAIADEARP